jgi:hypothetical protein
MRRKRSDSVTDTDGLPIGVCLRTIRADPTWLLAATTRIE